MKKIAMMVWLCLCLTVITAGGADIKEPGMIGPAARWTPEKQVLEQIRKDCSPLAGKAFEACFVSGMQQSGASPSAVAFTKLIGNMGYLEELRNFGPVDIAYVVYPFRANENQGFLLVNGSPPLIDVDDLNLLSAENLKKDPSYRRLAKKFPALSLWYGDRSEREYPLMERTPEGGQRFVVRYRLLNGCHACELAGLARYAFDFDRSGKFTGTTFLETETPSEAGRKRDDPYSDPSVPVAVGSGKIFTLTLRSNPTTGYVWQLTEPLNKGVVQLVSHEYRGDKTGLAGAGGREIWTFKAVAPGEAAIDLKYVRPWETKAAPAKAALFKVIAGEN